MCNLIDNDFFMETYIEYWKESYNAYCRHDRTTNIFWLTNACGKPANLPSDWEGGTTCISDEKTSVGMDRTDDIKKGIYQVLKLGSEGKNLKSDWRYKVGIISNIHPARHFETCLGSIKDLMWTISEKDDVTKISDLPPDQPIYNLFDGIVTFTKSYTKDGWVTDSFSLSG